MTEPMKLSELPPEVWQRVSDLFDEVLELDERERIAYIRTLWVSEPVVAGELVALLVAAANADKTAPLAQSPFNSVLGEALAEPAQGYQPGAKFGAWTLEKRLGQGGMGEVWRAVRSDGLYKAAVAIKLLRTDLPHDKLSRRFARERVVLARLNHPHIARLLDAGVEAGQAFIVLELINGTPLLDYVEAHATTLKSRVQLLRDITMAVEHAHNQLVLHRDLKPSNVLVTNDGQVKLLDFGIAGVLDDASAEPMTKLTQLTGRGMTLEYASPEQVTGDATMPASDVYSLGVLLFHLATGNRPFAGSSTRAALEYAVVHNDPPLASETIAKPLSEREKTGKSSKSKIGKKIVDQIAPPVDAHRLRGDLDAIISRAMRLAPEERYPTAAAFAADLDAWMSERPTSIHAGDRTYATRLWFKRHWKLTGAVVATVLAVMAALGVILWQRGSALATADVAMRQLDNVMAQLPALATPDSEATLDAKRQHAELLLRASRPADALKRLDEMSLVTLAKHGKDSLIYGKLQAARASALFALGRADEARAAKAEADAALRTK
jgi:eukaryotic-like serine/threonine-protein kinase